MAWRKIQFKGDSFFVVIPADIIREFNLKKGDSLNFQSHKDQNYIHVGIVPRNPGILDRAIIKADDILDGRGEEHLEAGNLHERLYTRRSRA
jgi:antitoxin component of MazEF toxin-antitoxin module